MGKIKSIVLVLVILILSGCPATHNNNNRRHNEHYNNNNGHNQYNSNLVCATNQSTCATNSNHVGESCHCQHDGHSQTGTVVNRNNNNHH